MGALLEQFRAAGVAFVALPDGNLRAHGALSDPVRASIREHKAEILAELAANDCATPAQEAELRALVARVAASWPEAERAEALAVALADPEAALTSWRALAAELQEHVVRQYPDTPYTSAPLSERDPADDRRTCRDCLHLSVIRRCTAAARGDPNTDAGRSGFPIDDLLRRCLAYAPGPDDPDRRGGAERWPGMVEDAIRRHAMATETRHG